MSDYAVVWSDSDTGQDIWAGRLEVLGERVRLRGANGYDLTVHDLREGELADVDRADGMEQIGGYRSLRVELRTGRVFVIACLLGTSVLVEIADALSNLL